MRLVVFKLNHLGDNVVFLPGVQALRAQFPDWQTTVITTPQEKVLYENTIAPGELLTCPKLRFDKCWRRPWELAAWYARVRSRRPDACLVSFDQANVPHFLARSSGARLRVGGNLQHIRFRNTLTHDIPLPAGGWVAEWNWTIARVIARELGGRDLPATPPPPDLSHLATPSTTPRARPRLVVHAGASSEFTRWPIEQFAAVATALAGEHEVIWIDRPETAAAALPPTVRRFAPDSLKAFVAQVATADLFLGNNSGPMHVANALGRAGVIVTGSTARGWDPYWHRERWTVLRHPALACQPCERPSKVTAVCVNTAAPFACLRYWSVDAVTQACRETLARTGQIRQA